MTTKENEIAELERALDLPEVERDLTPEQWREQIELAIKELRKDD